MNNKPIYVELEIRANLDQLWMHTQNPQLHEQWDLRFSQIQYLPQTNESDIQKFRYETRIGFGLKISGTGETSCTTMKDSKERVSTLTFASAQPVSLIRMGGGYWKYKDQGDKLTFITLFNYQTRFGIAGRVLDRFIFRPIFGWATAWSFDRLRIWLEEHIPPSVVAERALIHYLSICLIVLLWCYKGLVPKLLFPETGELAMMKQLGLFKGMELPMVHLVGICEMGFGVLIACFHRRKWIFIAHVLALFLLTTPALLFHPEVLTSPFNPITLSLPMIGLGLTAYLSRRHLPQARRCKRQYK
ncbi:DoxX-like family protein [Bacillus sp. FJAT-28004]|uniref:DoxX-like family protein n=1 Tax=Bacillus sp. FJAT-28004 TaxID=1679165 RepID=UPI0006B4B030|nr:DoxX-like family protein [Bacillus sp. FJAT-28004]